VIGFVVLVLVLDLEVLDLDLHLELDLDLELPVPWILHLSPTSPLPSSLADPTLPVHWRRVGRRLVNWRFGGRGEDILGGGFARWWVWRRRGWEGFGWEVVIEVEDGSQRRGWKVVEVVLEDQKVVVVER
jgi:hypothetical protein